jgi:Glycosyl transferase family 11
MPLCSYFMSIVVCRLPKTGLGNQLFPLMKAYTFAHLNGLPVVVTGYHQFKAGPYIRREKSKRRYSDYFTFQKSLLAEKIDKWKTSPGRFQHVIKEPLLCKVEKKSSVLYEFSAIPNWSDYFEGLKSHRELVRRLFHNLIKDSISAEVEKLPVPFIGIHVRMGDFRKLGHQEDFSKVGAVRTPETYFVETIQTIRNIYGADLPVTVFTDGYKSEFKELFTLPAVNLMQGNKDIVDMLLLSKSRIIVTSAGSTFSYWAGFLSDAPVILHPDHIHNSLRSNDNGLQLYEGAINKAHGMLINSITQIRYEKSN